MAFKLVTPPTEAVVELLDVKAHLNVEHDEDDELIVRLRNAAERYIEKQTARQIMSATWDLFLDRFPCGPIEIRKPPVTEVSEIEYADSDGNLQTLADFQADTVSEPARVFPAFNASWPTTRNVPNAVRVRFVAGYTAVTLPEEAQQVVLLLVGHWYQNREGVLTGTISKPIEFAVEALRDNLKWTL